MARSSNRTKQWSELVSDFLLQRRHQHSTRPLTSQLIERSPDFLMFRFLRWILYPQHRWRFLPPVR